MWSNTWNILMKCPHSGQKDHVKTPPMETYGVTLVGVQLEW